MLLKKAGWGSWRWVTGIWSGRRKAELSSRYRSRWLESRCIWENLWAVRVHGEESNRMQFLSKLSFWLCVSMIFRAVPFSIPVKKQALDTSRRRGDSVNGVMFISGSSSQGQERRYKIEPLYDTWKQPAIPFLSREFGLLDDGYFCLLEVLSEQVLREVEPFLGCMVILELTERSMTPHNDLHITRCIPQES